MCATRTVRGDVIIVDVFPRDGLQTLLHEPQLHPLTTGEKVRVIQALDSCGVPEIEVTGFVHPRVIPSLADAEEVVAGVLARPHRAVLRALVPNFRGAQRAIAAGMEKVSCLIVASETYGRLNSNMSVQQNLDQIERIVHLAGERGVSVDVSIGTSFICPYEGVMAEAAILHIVEHVVNLGVGEVKLADSIGMAWPTLVRQRCRAVLDRFPEVTLGLHLHTLGGMALANAFVAYEAGARSFDGSVGGIGGGIAMPVHTTDMGNVATEDLAFLFESCGVETGIDLPAIAALGREMERRIGTGRSAASSFGTLEDFLAANRERLQVVSEAPPGNSRRGAEAR